MRNKHNRKRTWFGRNLIWRLAHLLVCEALVAILLHLYEKPSHRVLIKQPGELSLQLALPLLLPLGSQVVPACSPACRFTSGLCTSACKVAELPLRSPSHLPHLLHLTISPELYPIRKTCHRSPSNLTALLERWLNAVATKQASLGFSVGAIAVSTLTSPCFADCQLRCQPQPPNENLRKHKLIHRSQAAFAFPCEVPHEMTLLRYVFTFARYQ